MIFDPNAEVPVEYHITIADDVGLEFAGFTPSYSVPPSFDLTYIPPVDVAVVVPEPEEPEVQVDIPGEPPKASPI